MTEIRIFHINLIRWSFFRLAQLKFIVVYSLFAKKWFLVKRFFRTSRKKIDTIGIVGVSTVVTSITAYCFIVMFESVELVNCHHFGYK
ncbi:hypothetical protein L596_028762 [Steinernema carpocapsae]|uniref:Uncharacterized protein n=1 Tax=Steinernema carpocapsae TaxID=34508 RepID=A0A4U5LZF4_STECR|nr:hypothetical protein L596_028762 [Steinernema carpocapsae]